MQTLYTEIRAYVDELLYSGNAAWAERLNDAISYTGSGTEALMGVRFELNHALLSGELSDPEHEATAKLILEKVEGALGD